MKKKLLLIIGVFLFVFILLMIIALFIFTRGITTSPKVSILEECKTLFYNGNDKTNIVFFSNEEEARKYIDSLLSFNILNKKQNEFNFFYIDDYKPDCELYNGVALFCHSRDLVKKTSSCPNDYIVVIEKQPSNIRSSAYLNVISINSENPSTVLAHEFGHVFANLAEEYVPANKLPRGQRNCVEGCKDFLGLENGCFQGCSKDNLLRSIENGIMRTLKSEEFGNFNEYLIDLRIIESIEKKSKSITGRAVKTIEDCSEEEYYLIDADYNNGTIEVLSKSIEQGCPGTNGFGDLSYNFISENTLIDSGNFNAELIFTDGGTEEEIDGELFDNNESFTIKLPTIEKLFVADEFVADEIPIVKKSAKLEIMRVGKVIKEIDLTDIGARACLVQGEEADLENGTERGAIE